jgi:hypothetical protein
MVLGVAALVLAGAETLGGDTSSALERIGKCFRGRYL